VGVSGVMVDGCGNRCCQMDILGNDGFYSYDDDQFPYVYKSRVKFGL
jgi:hypothetical protein